MYKHARQQQTAALQRADNESPAKARAHHFNTGPLKGIDAMEISLPGKNVQRMEPQQ